MLSQDVWLKAMKLQHAIGYENPGFWYDHLPSVHESAIPRRSEPSLNYTRRMLKRDNPNTEFLDGEALKVALYYIFETFDIKSIKRDADFSGVRVENVGTTMKTYILGNERSDMNIALRMRFKKDDTNNIRPNITSLISFSGSPKLRSVIYEAFVDYAKNFSG